MLKDGNELRLRTSLEVRWSRSVGIWQLFISISIQGGSIIRLITPVPASRARGRPSSTLNRTTKMSSSSICYIYPTLDNQDEESLSLRLPLVLPVSDVR